MTFVFFGLYYYWLTVRSLPLGVEPSFQLPPQAVYAGDSNPLFAKKIQTKRIQGECRTMPARKPYQKMLKLPKHWKISRVEHAENGSRVDLWLKHEPHVFRCSKCHEPATTYAHMEEQVLLHPDTSERRMFLHVRRPLVSCHEHGITPGKFFAEGFAESE